MRSERSAPFQGCCGRRSKGVAAATPAGDEPGNEGWGTQPPQDGVWAHNPRTVYRQAATSGACEACGALSSGDSRQGPGEPESPSRSWGISGANFQHSAGSIVVCRCTPYHYQAHNDTQSRTPWQLWQLVRGIPRSLCEGSTHAGQRRVAGDTGALRDVDLSAGRGGIGGTWTYQQVVDVSAGRGRISGAASVRRDREG